MQFLTFLPHDNRFLFGVGMFQALINEEFTTHEVPWRQKPSLNTACCLEQAVAQYHCPSASGTEGPLSRYVDSQVEPLYLHGSPLCFMPQIRSTEHLSLLLTTLQ